MVTKDTFSEAQCEQIAKMIQNSMKAFTGPSTSHLLGRIYSVSSSYTAYNIQTKSQVNWILDSGATDHIVSSIQLLSNSKPLSSVLHLPNGSIAPITHIGEVMLSPTVVLHDVLCVPSFHCHLISITKLTADTSATVVFSNHNCVL